MHLIKCMGCGVEKDLDVLTSYPYPEDGIVIDPIEQMMLIECEGDLSECKIVVVCHECFHKLNPDLWINREIWEAICPIVSFDRLPDDDLKPPEKWDPRNYSNR